MDVIDTKHRFKMVLGLMMFLSELFFFFSVGYLAYRKVLSAKPGAAILLSFSAVWIVIVLWAQFVSPQSKYRLSLVPRVVSVSVVMFGVAAWLFLSGATVIGIILAVTTILFFIPGQILIHGAKTREITTEE